MTRRPEHEDAPAIDDEDTPEDLEAAWEEIYGPPAAWRSRTTWTTQPRARRSHTCSTPECRREIARGDLYRREAVLVPERRGAHVHVTKRCCQCEEPKR